MVECDFHQSKSQSHHHRHHQDEDPFQGEDHKDVCCQIQ